MDFCRRFLVFFIYSKNLTLGKWNTAAVRIITLIYLWKIVWLLHKLVSKHFLTYTQWWFLGATTWAWEWFAGLFFSKLKAILIELNAFQAGNSLSYDILELENFVTLAFDPFISFSLSCGFNQSPRVRLEEFWTELSYYSQMQIANTSLLTHPWCRLLGERVWKVAHLLIWLLLKNFNFFFINTVHKYSLYYLSNWDTIMRH